MTSTTTQETTLEYIFYIPIYNIYSTTTQETTPATLEYIVYVTIYNMYSTTSLIVTRPQWLVKNVELRLWPKGCNVLYQAYNVLSYQRAVLYCTKHIMSYHTGPDRESLSPSGICILFPWDDDDLFLTTTNRFLHSTHCFCSSSSTYNM